MRFVHTYKRRKVKGMATPVYDYCINGKVVFIYCKEWVKK